MSLLDAIGKIENGLALAERTIKPLATHAERNKGVRTRDDWLYDKVRWALHPLRKDYNLFTRTGVPAKRINRLQQIDHKLSDLAYEIYQHKEHPLAAKLSKAEGLIRSGIAEAITAIEQGKLRRSPKLPNKLKHIPSGMKRIH